MILSEPGRLADYGLSDSSFHVTFRLLFASLSYVARRQIEVTWVDILPRFGSIRPLMPVGSTEGTSNQLEW